MILGHFEPGGLILHLLCLCLEGIIVKESLCTGKCIFICWWYRIFIFLIFISGICSCRICLFSFNWLSIDSTRASAKAMKVEIKEKGIIDEEKQIYRTETYLKNMFVGNVRMMDHIYELEDINVQYGACDVEIDLTTAMIPEGETVIVIRGVVGNIRLYVPYDIELSLNHSVIVGRVLLPGHEETGFNRNVTFRTEQYKEAPRRIKIISSLVVGDTEVRKV